MQSSNERRPLLDDEDKNYVEFQEKDDEDPKQWGLWRKVEMTALFSITTLGCTFTSSVFSAAQEDVSKEFGVSTLVATLGTSLYVLAYAFGPCAFGPASEFLGRKKPLILGYTIFALTQVIVATASGPPVILLGRFLGGFFSSAPLSITPGAMSDMWDNESRGTAIAIFSSVNFIGPSIAPLLGSWLATQYNWRAIEWLVAAYAAVVTIVNMVFLCETHAQTILQERARQLRTEPGSDQHQMARIEEKKLTFSYVTGTYFARPLKMLCFDPIILAFAVFTAFTFGVLYLSYVAFPIEYREVRGWSRVLSTAPNIAVIVGVALGLGVCIWYQPKYNKALAENDGQPVPEMRLPLLVVGAVVFPIGLFMFALASVPSVHWSISVMSIALIGFGIYMIFFSSLNYIVDAFLEYTASAVAANTLLRSMFGAIFPLFGKQLFEGLGVRNASLIITAFAALLLPATIVFLKYGKRIRENSKYAPTD